MFTKTTFDLFNVYMNDYEGNSTTQDEVYKLKIRCLETAKAIVERKLTYSIEENTINKKFINIYHIYIVLPAPASSITTLKVNENNIDVKKIIIDKNILYIDGFYDYKDLQIEIEYKTGWKEETLPTEILSTILSIATLLYIQSGKNIGITGLATGGELGFSRTFINYTNFDKYLTPLLGWII